MIRRAVLTLAALVASSSLMAQTNFLTMTGDASTMALAGASSAYQANYLSASSNMSATLNSDKTIDLGVSYMGLQPNYTNSQLIQVGGYYSLSEKLSLGAAFHYEMLPSQSVINNSGLAQGEFSPMGMSVDLGGAYAINDELSVGASVRYIFSDIYTSSESAFGGNINATYAIDNSTLSLGVNNIGTQGEIIAQPTNVELAGAHTFNLCDDHAVGAMASVSYIVLPEEMSSLTAGVAAEYGFRNMAFLRVGYRYGNAESYMPSYTSLGLGAKVCGVGIDAAYLVGAKNNPLNGSFMVGLSWSK